LKTGNGRTVDLSSSGVRFVADARLRPGDRIEVGVDWPLLLHGDVPLRLRSVGIVVWARGNDVGLQFLRHEF
jgi:hypothetical protein